MDHHLIIVGKTRDVAAGKMESCRTSSRFAESNEVYVFEHLKFKADRSRPTSLGAHDPRFKSASKR